MSSVAAVVLVHPQHYFLKELTAKDRKQLVSNLCTLVQFAASHEIPVASVVMNWSPYPVALARALREVPESHRYCVMRKTDNVFDRSGVTEWLQERNVDTTILGGVYAAACASISARAARQYFRVRTANGIIANPRGERPIWRVPDTHCYQSLSALIAAEFSQTQAQGSLPL